MTTKFKVGDRVRANQSTGTPVVREGWEGTILEVDGNRLVFTDTSTHNYFFSAKWFDLIGTPAQKLGYKVGDKFKVLRGTGCSNEGDIVELTEDDNTSNPYFQNLTKGRSACESLNDLEPIKDIYEVTKREISGGGSGNVLSWGTPPWSEEINNKTITQKIMDTLRQIPATLKRVLSPALSSQYRAEFINGDLKLTSKGKEALIDILAIKFEKELAEAADEIIKEVEKNTTK